MARTAITKTVALGAYPASLTTVVLTLAAADVANKNHFVCSGDSKELLIARNSGAGPHNLTITSKADTFNRTGDIVRAMAAAEVAIFGPFKVTGWKQSDNSVYLEADHAEVLLGVIQLP
jgi:hypothetical protein